jgi:dolichol kinase
VELTRKLAHVGCALLAALLPLLISYGEIAAIGLVFAGAMALSRRVGLFQSIHAVERDTLGEVAFPLGVAGAALLCPAHRPYVYAVLVLGLADTAAAVVGKRYARRALPFVPAKSVLGSASFFAVALAVGLGVGASAWLALGAALVLACVEALARRGSDNATVPITGALLFTVGSGA